MNIWYYDTSAEAYDDAMCNERIKNGDILVAFDDGVVGYLVEAWPTAVTAKHGQFHQWKDDVDPLTHEDGKWAISHRLALQVEKRLRNTGRLLA